MEKEFREAFEKLINKHIGEEKELLEELKKAGKFQKGLDGNHDDFKLLHQKHWEETKKLCDQYSVKYEDKK